VRLASGGDGGDFYAHRSAIRARTFTVLCPDSQHETATTPQGTGEDDDRAVLEARDVHDPPPHPGGGQPVQGDAVEVTVIPRSTNAAARDETFGIPRTRSG